MPSNCAGEIEGKITTGFFLHNARADKRATEKPQVVEVAGSCKMKPHSLVFLE